MQLGIDCLFNIFKHLYISVFTEFSYSISPLLTLFSLPPTLKSRGGDEKKELKAAVTLPNQEIWTSEQALNALQSMLWDQTQI